MRLDSRTPNSFLRRPIVRLALVLTLVLSTGACARSVIPNTDVEDNSSNREVVKFVELYRKAMERRDVAKLLSMAAPSYYDDNGTPNATDDFDYNRLKDELNSLHEKTLEVRYEIRYRRVTYHLPQIWVDYTYTGRFRIKTADGDHWVRRLADNRLVLTQKGENFQIISGM